MIFLGLLVVVGVGLVALASTADAKAGPSPAGEPARAEQPAPGATTVMPVANKAVIDSWADTVVVVAPPQPPTAAQAAEMPAAYATPANVPPPFVAPVAPVVVVENVLLGSMPRASSGTLVENLVAQLQKAPQEAPVVVVGADGYSYPLDAAQAAVYESIKKTVAAGRTSGTGKMIVNHPKTGEVWITYDKGTGEWRFYPS